MHEGPPSFAHKRPPYYFDVPEPERASRVEINDDLCRIAPIRADGSDAIYCIRATLDIPIIDSDAPFCWGVWVTHSEDAFQRYEATFDLDQTDDGAFGWLAVVLPYYRRTAPGDFLEHLACDVEWGPKGHRPKVIVRPCDHPLYRDQSEGITWDKAVEIARLAMHGPH
jgi:hypothetical protein